MTQLSPNFTLEELLRSQEALRLGIDNTPNDAQIANLTRLCTDLLEPARALLGVHLHVDSGFRSPQINADVGGASDSAHLEGRAADIIPIGMDLQTAFDKIRGSLALPADQCITECSAWLHLAIARNGMTPRREFLLATGGPGDWHYVYA